MALAQSKNTWGGGPHCSTNFLMWRQRWESEMLGGYWSGHAVGLLVSSEAGSGWFECWCDVGLRPFFVLYNMEWFPCKVRLFSSSVRVSSVASVCRLISARQTFYTCYTELTSDFLDWLTTTDLQPPSVSKDDWLQAGMFIFWVRVQLRYRVCNPWRIRESIPLLCRKIRPSISSNVILNTVFDISHVVADLAVSSWCFVIAD